LLDLITIVASDEYFRARPVWGLFVGLSVAREDEDRVENDLDFCDKIRELVLEFFFVSQLICPIKADTSSLQWHT
jgi:hypothetical protein